VRLAALLLLLIAAPPAHAHALGAEARLRGDRIEVEAYYSDNTPARDARVTVLDHAGRLAAAGRTDDQGRWQFPTPWPGPYTVTVDAGAGHRKSVPVTVPAVLPAGPTGPISDGPSREEFTRFPWLRLTVGLAIIAGLAVGWQALRRGLGRMPGPSNEQGDVP
jgi:hypothetical protein